MKEWEVWIEGYAATGGSGTASFEGVYKGETFKNAVESMMKDKQWNIEGYYNPERLTYWACRFFDNETDARKSFG